MIGDFLNIELQDIQERSDILDKPTKNEVVLLHAKAMKYEWKEYAFFEESTHASGRELIVQLPEEALNDLMQLKKLCDSLAERGIGENRDYEYVIRWNQKEANFHLLYSERKKNVGRTPRIYTRDFWYDKKTNRQAKPHAKNAELRFEEGTFQRDRSGKIKYEGPAFLEKDPFFASENWYRHMEETILKLFKEYGFIKDENYDLCVIDIDEKEQDSHSELVPVATPSNLIYLDERRDSTKQKSERSVEISEKIKGLLTIGSVTCQKIGSGISTGFKTVFKEINKRVSPFFRNIKRKLVNAPFFKKLMEFIS